MILGNPPKNYITLLKYNIALFLDQNSVVFFLPVLSSCRASSTSCQVAITTPLMSLNNY